MKNKMSKTKNIVVIGGGSWGGALADQLLKANNNVTVLTRRRETADALNLGSLIALPQVQLEHPIPSTTNPDCLSFADLIVIAVPLSETAQVVEMVTTYASLETVILLYKSLMRLQIVKLDPAPIFSSVKTFKITRPTILFVAELASP